jgi:hypothetical protein
MRSDADYDDCVKRIAQAFGGKSGEEVRFQNGTVGRIMAECYLDVDDLKIIDDEKSYKKYLRDCYYDEDTDAEWAKFYKLALDKGYRIYVGSMPDSGEDGNRLECVLRNVVVKIDDDNIIMRQPFEDDSEYAELEKVLEGKQNGTV